MSTSPTFGPTPYVPLFARYSQAPDGYEDSFFVHYYELSVPTSGLQRYPLQIENDADFYWRATMGSTDSIFQLQFFDAFGNPVSSDMDYAINTMAFQQPVPNWPEAYCPAGSTVLVTASDSGAGGDTLTIALIGVKRYKQ